MYRRHCDVKKRGLDLRCNLFFSKGGGSFKTQRRSANRKQPERAGCEKLTT